MSDDASKTRVVSDTAATQQNAWEGPHEFLGGIQRLKWTIWDTSNDWLRLRIPEVVGFVFKESVRHNITPDGRKWHFGFIFTLPDGGEAMVVFVDMSTHLTTNETCALYSRNVGRLADLGSLVVAVCAALENIDTGGA